MKRESDCLSKVVFFDEARFRKTWAVRHGSNCGVHCIMQMKVKLLWSVCLLLDNDSLKTFPQKQERNNEASITRQRQSKHASLTIKTGFSVLSMPRGYKRTQSEDGTEAGVRSEKPEGLRFRRRMKSDSNEIKCYTRFWPHLIIWTKRVLDRVVFTNFTLRSVFTPTPVWRRWYRWSLPPSRGSAQCCTK
jgi:hypothetical protein